MFHQIRFGHGRNNYIGERRTIIGRLACKSRSIKSCEMKLKKKEPSEPGLRFYGGAGPPPLFPGLEHSNQIFTSFISFRIRDVYSRLDSN